MTGIAVLIGVILLPLQAHADGGFEYDVALRGGSLYVGGDSMSGLGDVAILGDRIVAVGEAPGRARREIDATGLVVAPGFIDLHNHTDEVYRIADGWWLPASVHSNRNFLTQGVSTIVTGNCGSGPAPPEAVEAWLDKVDALPFGTNVAHLIPHGQLRLEVMGEGQAARSDPRPTSEELEQMKRFTDAGMRAGAWGLSTGLEYDPGARADTDELVALTRVVARHGGLYASHTRHEGPDPKAMLASYAEAIAIGERSGAPAHISHIKLAGKRVHGYTDQVIQLVEAARARGVAVTADQYPYIAGSTALSQPAPVEMRDGPAVLERYCEGDGRDALRAGVARFLKEETPPEGLLVSAYPWRWWWQGKTVAELAEAWDEDPVDVTMRLACGPLGGGIYFSQSEDVVRGFMRREWVATASDGSTSLPFVGRYLHPRLYGTFTRKLRRYVYDEGVVSLPFALRSMTALPARILGMSERGRLESGSFADVVAFDPSRVRDVATFEHSGRESEGIEYLFVNGTLSIDQGEYTGSRAGRALRHASARGSESSSSAP